MFAKYGLLTLHSTIPQHKHTHNHISIRLGSKPYIFLLKKCQSNYKSYLKNQIINLMNLTIQLYLIWGNISILWFKSNKSIEIRQIQVGYNVQTQTTGNTSIISGKQRNERNTEVKQKLTPTYTITTAILWTWYRTFCEKLAEPCFIGTKSLACVAVLKTNR